MHGGIGGGVCLLVIVLLVDIAQSGFQQMLVTLGFLGIVLFTAEFEIARVAFVFGVVYLVAGFCGGLYTGYNIYENLRIVLLFPSLIGATGFIVLVVALGSGSLLISSVVGNVILPYVGAIIGAYLGGYAINWGNEEE